jgi:dihydroxy-acid dehydratase
LPSRDLIADCVESVAMAHKLDGLVLLTNCDKITPGMIMAAARLDIPCIVVTVGPMADGKCHNNTLTMIKGTFEAVGKFTNGEIDEKMLKEMEITSCPGAGACQGLYTANTMACLTEVMGMSLPHCATAPAVSAEKRRIAFESGMQVVELVRQNKRPLDIINRDSLRNAIIADLGMGGSTNSFLHILAIANAIEQAIPSPREALNEPERIIEPRVGVDLNDFEELSHKIHQFVKLEPSNSITMTQFHQAGGVNAVLKELLKSVPEFKDLEGVTLEKTSEVVKNAYADKSIIHDYKEPFTTEPGLGILYGNIAP